MGYDVDIWGGGGTYSNTECSVPILYPNIQYCCRLRGRLIMLYIIISIDNFQ